jgi:hypothetical protein
MNESLFEQLYNRRSEYPLGVRLNEIHENAFDIGYINDEVARQVDSRFLFLLLLDAHLDKPQLLETREKISASYSMVGVFGVGAILNPFTNVQFTLYVFSKSQVSKVWFGELSSNKRVFKKSTSSKRIYQKNGMMEPEFGDLETYFVKYLNSINLAINGSKKDDYVHDAYRIFGVDIAKMGPRTSVVYYKPELIEAEAKISHEKTARLADLAEIIYPRRPFGTELPMYTIKLAAASYPLEPDSLQLVREGTMVAPLQKGDIVTNSFLNSAYLNMSDRNDIFAANTQIIIRGTGNQISREYLVVYLNSEKMRTYFERRSTGFMPRLSRGDLADFPVVLPSMHEQSELISQSYLKSLSGMTDPKQRMQDINNVLFTQKPPPNRPLQSEFFQEMRDALQPIKNVLVKDLFDSDLNEVQKCYEIGAYKGCLVMCGSILEALVLDWLFRNRREELL